MKTTAHNRIDMIDAMRGASLFGILLANMLIFQYGIWGKDEINFYSLSQANHTAYHVIKIAIEGSFMPIFTFLFGYSMVKMKEKLEGKALKYKRHFVRRFLALLLLGILHGTYLWEGDILTFYGMMGFFLLLFLNRKSNTILIWAVILLCLTSLLGYGGYEESKKEQEQMETYVRDTIEIYSTGTYSEIKEHRNNEIPLDISDGLFLFILALAPLISAPLFLLGIYSAKIGLFTMPQLEKKQYKLGSVLIPIGLALKSCSLFFPDFNWSEVFNFIGANLLSIGYIFLFAFLFTLSKEGIIKRAFISVGKLSLTNYLMQSIICTTIYYGYGFGYFGSSSVLKGITLAIGIFMIQMISSTFYLRLAKQGPIERVLRIVTNFSIKGPKSNKQTVFM
ncbi:DUF418 domain-containing protein [Metabacillus halosaccharovorans]|uniref:DUF418 domain-containing protein n=1 Tax=Metabacillus halosaccharovorans TaxID=930124 RepID=A0ABT3DC11_9BACI|nr:DUF418 domain-containing protein [Metabacillus halosaccharovorans]MCV9884602.1 DUF418 domain-containing protein [Metabacillus halosaccharovorans]